VAFSHTVTTDVVLTFLRSIFSREGNPDYIVTDNGPQFLSSSFADFLRERGISHLRTSVYHPQCNGAVERWNRVLKETILTAEHMQKDWKTTVTDFLQNYRATPHNTTGVSPSELLHNRKMKTKVNIFPTSEKSRKCTTVQETVRQKQEKSKQYTDKRRGAKTPTFKPGDMVRVKRPDHVRKGSSRFTSPLSQKDTSITNKPQLAHNTRLAPELPMEEMTVCGDMKIPDPIIVPAISDTAPTSPTSRFRLSFCCFSSIISAG
uniref:Integrase catalytic domain-containing protein n=1 Tax=Xiphophorus maculatus TaxID=8083 RepID=A0A3B5QD86_XIPMA